jgi:hypothetical protein
MYERDLVIKPNTGGVQRINGLNQCYDPICYVLLLPSGQSGWNIYTTSVSNSSTNVTAMKFYASRLMLEMAIIAYISFVIFFNNISWTSTLNLSNNACSHILSGLEDAARLDDGTTDLSSILPSSFVGSARYIFKGVDLIFFARIRKNRKPSHSLHITRLAIPVAMDSDWTSIVSLYQFQCRVFTSSFSRNSYNIRKITELFLLWSNSYNTAFETLSKSLIFTAYRS